MAKIAGGEEEDTRQCAITVGKETKGARLGGLKRETAVLLLANSPLTLIEGSIVKKRKDRTAN